MIFFALFLQVGELFKGNFSWRGLLHLSIFLAMGLLIVGFPAFIGYKIFQSERGKKNDV